MGFGCLKLRAVGESCVSAQHGWVGEKGAQVGATRKPLTHASQVICDRQYALGGEENQRAWRDRLIIEKLWRWRRKFL